jgi:preprotein translocase subunit SecD
LHLGHKIAGAINAGYRRAMSTIIDSNLTTLIGALLLFQFGSGSIRGFAVTMSLGIIISMFTAIALTRVIITWWFNWYRPSLLPI